jgi:hypothetical protein
VKCKVRDRKDEVLDAQEDAESPSRRVDAEVSGVRPILVPELLSVHAAA